MKKRKLKKNNLLFLFGIVLLFVSIVVFVVMLLNNHANSTKAKEQAKAHNYVAYQEVVVSDQDIDSSYNDKLTEGIKNWVSATLAMDDTYSSTSRTKLLNKFYDSVIDDNQRSTIRTSLTEFYSAKSITTSNIDVSISEAKQAEANNKTVGQVKCTASISGTRDGSDFQKVYDLTLILAYDNDPVGIYAIKDINEKS